MRQARIRPPALPAATRRENRAQQRSLELLTGKDPSDDRLVAQHVATLERMFFREDA